MGWPEIALVVDVVDIANGKRLCRSYCVDGREVRMIGVA